MSTPEARIGTDERRLATGADLRHPSATVAATTVPDQSAVSWAAILAGAAAAASLSLILLILGTGLGLSSVSPWAYEGVSAETFGWSTIIWLSLTSIAASGLGGYLAGRLRTKWTSVHQDESFFRDTAHGFLSWSVATLVTAAVLTSAIGSILGTTVQAGASVAGSATTAAAAGGTAAAAAADTSSRDAGSGLDYWVDSLFRGDSAADPQATRPTPAAGERDETPASGMQVLIDAGRGSDAADSHAQTARIFINSLDEESLDQADARHVAQLVSERTGMSTQQAQARVTEVHARMRTAMDEAETAAREAADEAREATAYAALWLFITLLMGAFFASLFAVFGGRQRDA